MIAEFVIWKTKLRQKMGNFELFYWKTKRQRWRSKISMTKFLIGKISSIFFFNKDQLYHKTWPGIHFKNYMHIIYN